VGHDLFVYKNGLFGSQLPLRPSNCVSLRVLLPTNGYPVKVTLLGSISREGRFNRALQPLRFWLYQKNWLSPVRKFPVPFELKATNVLTKFAD